jgi:hypothetical protein
VFVNGRNLVDILREVELPFSAREGNPNLAGNYVGLPLEEVSLPSPVYSARRRRTTTTIAQKARSPFSAAGAQIRVVGLFGSR